jgi:hypothetical protein
MMASGGGGDLNVGGLPGRLRVVGFCCPRPREEHGFWGLSTGNDGLAPLRFLKPRTFQSFRMDAGMLSCCAGQMQMQLISLMSSAYFILQR